MNNNQNSGQNIGGILKQLAIYMMCGVSFFFVLALIGSFMLEQGELILIAIVADIIACFSGFLGCCALYAFGVNTENIAAIKNHLTGSQAPQHPIADLPEL